MIKGLVDRPLKKREAVTACWDRTIGAFCDTNSVNPLTAAQKQEKLAVEWGGPCWAAAAGYRACRTWLGMRHLYLLRPDIDRVRRNGTKWASAIFLPKMSEIDDCARLVRILSFRDLQNRR